MSSSIAQPKLRVGLLSSLFFCILLSISTSSQTSVPIDVRQHESQADIECDLSSLFMQVADGDIGSKEYCSKLSDRLREQLSRTNNNLEYYFDPYKIQTSTLGNTPNSPIIIVREPLPMPAPLPPIVIPHKPGSDEDNSPASSTPISQPTPTSTTTPTPTSTPTSTSTSTPTPTGSSAGAGFESKPVNTSYPSVFRSQNPFGNDTERFVASKTIVYVLSFFPIGIMALTAPLSDEIPSRVNLKTIIPAYSLPGTNPVVQKTGQFFMEDYVVDSLAIDFIDNITGINKAAIFATKTLKITYNHDYSICNRYHEYTLENASAVPISGIGAQNYTSPWFWHASMTRKDLQEEAFIFAVLVDENNKTLTVDSRWLAEQYPSANASNYDYALNFQVWSSSFVDAQILLRDTIGNLFKFGKGWIITFANEEKPKEPSVLISNAQMKGNTVEMVVQNRLPQTREVNFSCFFSYPNGEASTIVCPVNLSPGSHTVDLPLNGIRDAVIEVQLNGFKDKVYVGSGEWYSFNDSTGFSHVTLIKNCATMTNSSPNSFALPCSARMTGIVGEHGWVGMTRTLNPSDLPVDISKYQALAFFAKGDGKSYRVSMETKSVRDLNSGDFHQFVFTPSTVGRKYLIPFSSLKQRGWDINKSIPFKGDDVISIAWSSVGDPISSIDLSIDRVALICSSLINETDNLPSMVRSNDPYKVEIDISDDSNISSINLMYSLNEGKSFTRIPMTHEGTFSAMIPRQPNGTEVRYYVEEKDTSGNVATDPIDAPISNYRFLIGKNHCLLIDDFADTNPNNLIGGNSGLYGEDTGSDILSYYDNGNLRLDFNTTTKNSYAGYYTSLSEIDLTPYNALAFRIRGSHGKEKVLAGLRDCSLNETKVLIDEYLPGGITSSWKNVIIPLKAFTGIGNWSCMDNFNIAFEEKLGSESGTIFLDDIEFKSNV